jgi:hypothetical protein
MHGANKLPDQSWRAVTNAAQPGEVTGYLIDELFKASGLGGDSIWRKWFGGALTPVIRRFASQAEAFDRAVARDGFQCATQSLLAKWTAGLRIEGQDQLPQTGPLLVAANHPGIFDAMSVASVLPREDLKIVAAANPVLRALPNIRRYFIYSTLDTHVRMATIRRALRQLKQGGALLICSSGKLDPDPYYFPQAASRALERWSRSLELLLEKVPETKLVIAINFGFVAPEFMQHPLTHLRRNDEARQKLAEFIQVIQHLLQGRRVNHISYVAFSQPISRTQLTNGTDSVHVQIIKRAQQLMDFHSDRLRKVPGDSEVTAGADCM